LLDVHFFQIVFHVLSIKPDGGVMVVERILIDIKPRRGDTANQSSIRMFHPFGVNIA